MRNFSDEKNRTAASKNAVALLQKKRYELSAAFFLLAGSVEDACNLAIDRLQDIQLAVLMCRLCDTSADKRVLRKIVNEHFVRAGVLIGDCFLRHIGFTLLGEHINAFNALFENLLPAME
jgi:hypothetical protein